MPGMAGTMHEWKAGTLHSGSKKGPIVKSRAQAIAIGLSESRRKLAGGDSGTGTDRHNLKKPVAPKDTGDYMHKPRG